MSKEHASYSYAVTLLVLSVLVISACTPGAVMQETTSSGKSEVDPEPPSYAQPQPAPEDLGESAEVIAGQVTVNLSASDFSQGEVIEFTVSNGLDQIIYVEDMKTSCSIAVLEVKEGDSWSPLLNCGMERLPMVLPIGPGMGRMVSIDPLAAEGAVPGESTLATGTYRVRFSYRMEPEPEGEEPFSVLSEEFKLSR